MSRQSVAPTEVVPLYPVKTPQPSLLSGSALVAAPSAPLPTESKHPSRQITDGSELWKEVVTLKFHLEILILTFLKTITHGFYKTKVKLLAE